MAGGGAFDKLAVLERGASADEGLAVWDPSAVLLVVEVSDDTVLADLNVKSTLYGTAGYPVYWVVTQDVIYEHTLPTARAYRTRTEYRPGERIPVGYADTSLAVADLLA